VLVAGGYNSSNTVLQSAEIFTPTGTPTAGTWTATTNSMNVDRVYHSAVRVVNSGAVNVLLLGGYSGAQGTDLSTAELFSPLATTSCAASSTIAYTGGPMQAARALQAIARLDLATGTQAGDVVVMGGVSNGVPLSSAELWRP
jgi:hypothetical protein